MLLKYLNELEQAVQEASLCPGPVQYQRCLVQAAVLRAYLDGQVEPLRRHGLELMENVMPPELHERMARHNLVRPDCPGLPVASAL